ncbi:MAG: hypothetical protein WD845_02145 [Pirellulales bacterium]
MPSTYDNLGVRFLYPDSWILDEEDSPSATPSVTVQSPGGAFWSLAIHSPSADPDELAQAALEALAAEYRDSESEPVTERIGGRLIDGFDFHFFYLDFVSTALIRGFRTATASCLLLCQAEDREFDELAAVFRAITTSLLSSDCESE